MKTLIRALAALAVALSVPEVAHAISGPSDVQRGGTITDSTSANVVINIEGLQSVAFNIQGSTGTYTVKAYVSPDGANWVVTEVFLPVDETTATSITADGLYIVEYTSGMKAVKVQATACTTCSVPIYMRATAGSPPLTQTLTSVAGTAASGAAADGGGFGYYQVLRLGLPDRFTEHGAQNLLYDHYGLSAPKIASRVASWLGRKAKVGVAS